MKHRRAVILMLILSIVMIDLGLWGVAIDAAYRMDYPNIQFTALAIGFFLPLLIIPGLYKELRRAVAVGAFIVSVFGLVYFIMMYGLQLLDIEMLGYTAGYIIAMIMLLRITIYPFNKQLAVNK